MPFGTIDKEILFGYNQSYFINTQQGVIMAKEKQAIKTSNDNQAVELMSNGGGMRAI